MSWTPVVIATLLVPLLVFGFLRGGLFVAHAHGDQTTHFHAISPVSAFKLIVGEHCEEHRHDHDHSHDHSRDHQHDHGNSDAPCDSSHEDDDASTCDHAPEGLLVSFAQPKQLPVRAVDVSKTLHQLTVTVVIAILPTTSFHAAFLDPPEATVQSTPMDFIALGTSQRLVRTSHALLL